MPHDSHHELAVGGGACPEHELEPRRSTLCPSSAVDLNLIESRWSADTLTRIRHYMVIRRRGLGPRLTSWTTYNLLVGGAEPQ